MSYSVAVPSQDIVTWLDFTGVRLLQESDLVMPRKRGRRLPAFANIILFWLSLWHVVKSEYSESHWVFGADNSAPHIEVILCNKTFQLYKKCMKLGENSIQGLWLRSKRIIVSVNAISVWFSVRKHEIVWFQPSSYWLHDLSDCLVKSFIVRLEYKCNYILCHSKGKPTKNKAHKIESSTL